MKHREKRAIKASTFLQSKLLFVIRIQGSITNDAHCSSATVHVNHSPSVLCVIAYFSCSLFSVKATGIHKQGKLALSEHGIICIEDIVKEIANVGPQFKDVCNFSCPFSLNKPEKACRVRKGCSGMAVILGTMRIKSTS
ncbi:hypothetical protein L6452_15074 [Arctium lappa]|uniref:Uncharacterized protein n=1 Tax=Arctium lappa TaxID=4217 RepID=A0ACB9CMV8_ARCLA|nr:hypothetical protein L6452_15074 [Arctium lappa]